MAEHDAHTSNVLERFLRYVQVDTQSAEEHADVTPSSAIQFDLANLLADELRDLGAENVEVTDHAYVVAHIPASAGCEDRPRLGLLAHLDTTQVVSGFGVKPHIVHYEGGELVCGTVDGTPVSIGPDKVPALNTLCGEDLVCSDGTTLLGGDDKAGVAEIMALVERLVRHPVRRYQRIHAQLAMFHKSAGIMGRSFKLYFVTAVLTVVQITVNSLISYFIYRSFALPAESVSVVTMVAAQVFVAMVSAFVPLPGASGGAEGSFVIFFGKFFGQDIVPAMFLWRLLTYYVNIALGGFFSVWGGKRYAKHEPEPSPAGDGAESA